MSGAPLMSLYMAQAAMAYGGKHLPLSKGFSRVSVLEKHEIGFIPYGRAHQTYADINWCQWWVTVQSRAPLRFF